MPRVLLVLAALTALAGCRLEQSAACSAYVACQAAYDDALDLDRVNTERFSAEGDCWTHPDVADDCSQICSVQREALANAAEDAGLDLPECE